ncbi:glycosyltransferase family 2 protein [Amphibacillus jilinensis]|uniref:glycosyltransferase family 2 protein n=1 Tax=Amphibacillus jilinensis TaxID=1216008 RepID=UPI0002EBC2FC|nr:glycosyltransferase family A protein [Amphibacillus jilinensis]
MTLNHDNDSWLTFNTDDLPKELADEKSKVIRYEEQLKELRKELDSIKKTNNNLVLSKKKIEKKYKGIKKSRSWKLTALARKFKGKSSIVNKTSNSNRVVPKSKINDNNGKAEKDIALVKRNMLNFGFEEKANQDLQDIVQNGESQSHKRLAARELVLWYSNLRTVEGAKKALELLPIALEGETNDLKVAQLSVLEIEAYIILGEKSMALKPLERVSKSDSSAFSDALFTVANIEEKMSNRIRRINEVLTMHNLKNIEFSTDEDKANYDRIYVKKNTLKYIEPGPNVPLISVVMPVYNAETYVKTALDAMLQQTWKNIELIVVDDCSEDNTTTIVEQYQQKDSRIKLLKTANNGGPYVARNMALKIAKGEFVTTNDSDDWSHPQKLEIQAKHLINNPTIIGNTSQQVRATNELKFYRRGNYRLMFTNMSSFMFRRDHLLSAVGYLDCVRFGADAEYLRRINKYFGRGVVVNLKTGPLSFQRQSSTSLTGNSAFGYHGYFMGARREYVESQGYYHNSADSLYYPFPMKNRLFPVPEPMWPTREDKDNKGKRYFDVIIIQDFRFSLDYSSKLISHYLDNADKDLRVGLVQMYQYNLSNQDKINSELRSYIDGDKVQMLVYGENIKCNSLIILDPTVFEYKQKFTPQIETNVIKVIDSNNSLNKRTKGREQLKAMLANVYSSFNDYGTWHMKEVEEYKDIFEGLMIEVTDIDTLNEV